MRVFLDDLRPTPGGWVRCNRPSEVIALLETGQVTELSLDHDLGLVENGREITGYDVLVWLEEQVYTGAWNYTLPAISIHSDNSSAREKMQRAIDSIKRGIDRVQ